MKEQEDFSNSRDWHQYCRKRYSGVLTEQICNNGWYIFYLKLAKHKATLWIEAPLFLSNNYFILSLIDSMMSSFWPLSSILGLKLWLSCHYKEILSLCLSSRPVPNRPGSLILSVLTVSCFQTHSFITKQVTFLFVFPLYSKGHTKKHYRNAGLQQINCLHLVCNMSLQPFSLVWFLAAEIELKGFL